MAETTWTEEEATGPRKKRVPTWVWFCGGGCLLAVLIAVVLAGLGMRFVRTAMDPDVQWQKLALILPYDARPPEMRLMFGNQIGLEQYTIEDTRGFQFQIQNHSGKDGAEGRERMFGTDNPAFPKNMGVMKFEDLAPGKVEVQGRELRLIRMRMEFSGVIAKMMPAEARDRMGSMAFIDGTPEGRDGMLFLQISRTKGEGIVTDDEIRMLLQPFHIGPKR
jgi:hypothetical protein